MLRSRIIHWAELSSTHDHHHGTRIPQNSHIRLTATPAKDRSDDRGSHTILCSRAQTYRRPSSALFLPRLSFTRSPAMELA